MPSGRARDSTSRKGGDVGTEKPTTDEVESKGWEVEVEVKVEVASDFDDSFITRDVNSGTGSGVGVDRISLVSGSAHGPTIS